MLDFPPLPTADPVPPATSLPVVQAVTLKTAALAHFSALETPLRALAERYRAVAFDLSTPKGLDAAKKARNDLRENGRYAVQRAEDAFKAAANEAKKAVAPKVEELIAIIKPVEDHVHAQITARETQLAEEKAERERKEAERVAAHEARLATLRGYVDQAKGLSSARIEAGIVAVEAIAIEADAWEEFYDRALAAKAVTIVALWEMKAAAEQAEREKAESDRVRAENERLRAELAEAKRAAQDATALAATQAAAPPETKTSGPETPAPAPARTEPKDGDCLYAPLRATLPPAVVTGAELEPNPLADSAADQQAVREFAFSDVPVPAEPPKPAPEHPAAPSLETHGEAGTHAAALEVRLNEDGSLDEIVGTGHFHLEQMDTNHWWMRFEDASGKAVSVWLRARSKVTATHEVENASSKKGV